MSKPLSMLTAIDYWLENLMNDIPVIEFCYHINGIVQKYEEVKTENIPCLNGSNFSPSAIYDYMQYMISFLKENTTIVGHTYWLFKGKDEDTVNLYDLTTLYTESLTDSPNPFTIPVTILLYRVAHKLLKHNPESRKPINTVNIILLLNNILKLLDKTKYPEIIVFVNYMQLDIYNKMYIDSLRTNDLNYCDDCSDTCHAFNVIPPYFYENYEIVSHEKKSIFQISEYLTSKYNLKPVDKCLYKALYYIGGILSCLQNLKKDKDIMVCNIKTSSGTRHIITNLISEVIASNKKNYKGMKKKNQYQDFKNLEDIESYIITELISMSWIDSLNVQNSDLDNFNLTQLLYENAFKIYFILGEKCYASKNFGISVNYIRRSLECKLRVSNNKVFDSFEDMLEHCGNCFSSIVSSWDKIEQYISEIESDEMFDSELREMLLHNSSEHCINKNLNIIPAKIIKSKESILSLAEHCYSRALLLTTDKKNILNKRMGFVYNEYTTFYMNEIIMAIQTNTPLTPIKLKWLIKKSKHYFTLGSDIFKDQGDLTNFTRIGLNFANLNVSIYTQNKCSKYQNSINEFMKYDNLLLKAIKVYEKILSEFNNNRSYNPSLWDDVNYELFSILHYLSVQKYSELQPDSTRSQQKCIIDSFNKALSYCDLKNDTPNRFQYEYRSAHIHSNLASLFSNHLEEYISNKSPEIGSVLLQIELYYNISYETYLKINCTFDCLNVLIEMIKLDMGFIDGKIDTQHEEKHVKSIIKKLRKYDTVFQMFLENKDYDLNFETIKLNFLKILHQNVCFLLKCMIKLGLTRTSKWLSDNVDQLKSIYKELLRNIIGDNNYLQLKIAINQLSSFSDN
ncbi:hypothetical protein AGLY_016748 [Aphis glycines]|uniref:Erythroid differentiation-related factor 1 n=1 Tax=Aphis glycines TaxID=307491 RepID=A0A6G0SYT7_APHGL|nr:hypothetical protein AGLY_016748 [Aphis glycines]